MSYRVKIDRLKNGASPSQDMPVPVGSDPDQIESLEHLADLELTADLETAPLQAEFERRLRMVGRP